MNGLCSPSCVMAAESSYPAAVDVTPSIYNRMIERVPDEWKERFQDPLKWDDSMREQVAAVLLPAAVSEAIARSRVRGDRGAILYDQKDLETIIYYISQGNTDTVLWMATPETQAEVNGLVESYNPESEAVVVMVGAGTVQVMWVREDGKIETSGAKSTNSLPIRLPEAVTMATEEEDGVYAYCFNHQQLGELGRIRLIPSATSRLEFETQVTPGETEAQTQEKETVFAPIAQTIVQRLKQALAEGE